MTRINRLDESTFKRIAAGEVITSPAGAVKELVENALDADATAVTVEILEGGRDFIRVTDNGRGMSSEDLALSIEKHTTSKIETFEDVYALGSLGFRGEALASIAEVARLVIASRERGSESGSELTVIGGGDPVLKAAGLPEGTTVRVDDLFFNVPARRKFMKSAARESAAVTEVVKQLILSRPATAFKYIRNGRVVYQTSGDGDLRQAAAVVYGPDILRQMVDVSYDGSHATVQGIVSRPTYIFKTGQRLDFFLNSRYIQSKAMQKAVEQGYHGSILNGHHPACILSIKADPATIDVNIHPAKLHVLLFQEEDVLRDVANAVANAVLKEVKPPQLMLQKADTDAVELDMPRRQIDFWQTVPRGTSLAQVTGTVALSKEGATASDEQEQAVAQDTYIGEPFEAEIDALNQEVSDGEHVDNTVSDIRTLTDYSIVGTAFSTYLLLETEENLYVIDQHAAQERLTFERLSEAARSGEKYGQQLLVPEIRTFSAHNYNLMEAHRELLNGLGFTWEPFGSLTLRFVSLPVQVAHGDLDRFLDDLIQELTEHSEDPLIARDRIISQACRHSVKAGAALTDGEIRRIVREITTMEAIPHCPHGRPIAVALKRSEIEKGFKRRI